MGELLEEGEGGARLAVVEDEARSGGLRGDEAEGGAEGCESEVGDYAQPGEEGGDSRVEAYEFKLLCQRVVLEVDGRVREGGWRRNAVCLEQLALPLLGCRVVDLEDAGWSTSKTRRFG